jgi:hypothetical protein
MRSVDDIRRVLLDHESLAPGGAGLIEAARAGAVRVRRRRRLTVAAAVVVALVVPVAVVASFRMTGTVESAVTPAQPHRDPLRLTVGVDPDGGYSVFQYWVNRNRQQLVLRPATGAEDATVVVHDPGTFDPDPVRRGMPVTVAGREARYIPDLDLGVTCSAAAQSGQPVQPGQPTGPRGSCAVVSRVGGTAVRMPVMAWAEPSGAWVVVFIVPGSTQADLVRAAAAVRTGPPRDVVAPYRLGYLPAELTWVYAATTDYGPRLATSLLAFDPDPALPVGGLDMATGFVPEMTAALTIASTRRTPTVDERVAELGRPVKVAGLDTYYANGNVGAWRIATGAAVFVVVAGACQFHINVRDRSRIPRSELVRMVENATFGDCADPATWTAPLG